MNDINIIRELAKEVLMIAHKPVQDERRILWRKQNSFKRVRPLIYVRAFAFNEIFDYNRLRCVEPFFRKYEYQLQMIKFRDTIGDDFIIEPWINVNAIFDPPVEDRWGIRVAMGEKLQEGGSVAFKPEMLSEDDIDRLVIPKQKINEAATKKCYEKLQNAIGDIIEVNLQRGPLFSMWTSDISTDLAKMRGLEQIMWDAYDRPEWLHKLLSFMRDGILKVHEEAENAGDFSLTNHENQSMTYSDELAGPKPNVFGVRREQLWWFMASQEFTTFGPDMFYEFILKYQIPILEKFGATAYGCCEDLTQKIDYLRKIPNLRRIAVSPFANAEKCAEQIGKRYILSWRPNPSSMISTGLDEDFVRRHMRENFQIFKQNENYFDITLKDVETINNKTENVSRWVQIVKEEIENLF